MGKASSFTKIFLLGLFIAFLPGRVSAKTLCETELAYRAEIVELTRAAAAEEHASRADLLRAENVLRVAQRNCGAIDDAAFKSQMLESHAELVLIAEREFRDGHSSFAEYAAAAIPALDLRWQVLAISTFDYCREKFDLLERGRSEIHDGVGAGELRRSAFLEAELAVQKHREFCDLEGSIVLPADSEL